MREVEVEVRFDDSVVTLTAILDLFRRGKKLIASSHMLFHYEGMMQVFPSRKDLV